MYSTIFFVNDGENSIMAIATVTPLKLACRCKDSSANHEVVFRSLVTHSSSSIGKHLVVVRSTLKLQLKQHVT